MKNAKCKIQNSSPLNHLFADFGVAELALRFSRDFLAPRNRRYFILTSYSTGEHLPSHLLPLSASFLAKNERKQKCHRVKDRADILAKNERKQKCHRVKDRADIHNQGMPLHKNDGTPEKVSLTLLFIVL